MDLGKKIYPHEGLNLMEEEIDQIKRRKIFTIETFKFVYQEPKFQSQNKEKLKQLLMDFGYGLKNSQNIISKEKVDQINMFYTNFDMEHTYKIKLRSRLTF
jgi:N-acetyl-anhydromuramyl-L-alanine amidase AmpD